MVETNGAGAQVANLEAGFEQGVRLHQQGNLAAAEPIYREVLLWRPNHVGALHLLGVIAHHTGRVELGVELIRRAIGLNPDFAAAHNNLGNALIDLKRPAEALASFDRAIALQPNYAEAYYNRGSVLLDLKLPAEALVSYDTAIALRPNYPKAYDNRGNVLNILKRSAEAVASFDQAIALKPDYAEAYSNRGNALVELKRLAEALASYDRAIALKPDYAEAYSNRGRALLELKRPAEALAGYDRAIALKPDYAEAHSNRGMALLDLTRPVEALASFERAIALRPDYAEAYSNRGMALNDLKRSADALASFERAIALKPDYAEAHLNQSLSLLLMGRFEPGWRQYEWRRKIDPRVVRSYPQPLWRGEDNIAGKTLFTYWEQGLGDTIQFCRYARLMEARGVHVILSVQQPLHGLLKQISPTIPVIGPDEDPGHFDYHCPLLSLPLAFGTMPDTIPAEPRYIKADEELRTAWSARLAPKTKPRIGVVWSGNGSHKNDHNRSMDLERFLPVVSPDADWICLQKEVRDKDRSLLFQDGRIGFFGADLRDFSDTAALLDLTDLVITIDTSVAHLAGAMGKPVWILLPHNPDWRWMLDRDDSPWYPRARLFRQRRFGNWTEIIHEVKEALRSVIGQDQPVLGPSGGTGSNPAINVRSALPDTDRADRRHGSQT